MQYFGSSGVKESLEVGVKETRPEPSDSSKNECFAKGLTDCLAGTARRTGPLLCDNTRLRAERGLIPSALPVEANQMQGV